jgi:hypothetical protein
MNVWLTPNLQPFVGGTYFPPEDGLTRVGFRTVLLRIREQVGVHPGGRHWVWDGGTQSPGPMLTPRCVPTSYSGNRIRTPCWKTASVSPQPCWPGLRSAQVIDSCHPLLPP